MDFRGCGCAAVVHQSMQGGLLALRDSHSPRRFQKSIRSGRQSRCGCPAVRASGSRDDYEFFAGGNNMVDADMIVLRKRIYELKRQENDYESPEGWMEWEKKWQGEYNSSVFVAMEWLQFNLINTRPAVGMAVVGLASVGVPASLAVALITFATYVGSLISSGHM